MELVPGFYALLQALSATMTRPTFESFTAIVTGWIFAPRRIITRMILAAGDGGAKHYSSYHRVFSLARWSLDRVGLTVFDLIVPWIEEDVLLAVDDTLARKRGLKMFGCGMHHDPLLSTRSKAVMNWGHSWVVLGVIVELPFRPGHFYCLPILFRLYLNKKKGVIAASIARVRNWRSRCSRCCASMENTCVFMSLPTALTEARVCLNICQQTVISPADC